jgi:HAD superfamily hydrolase (TIGR01450 family)
MSMPCGKTTNRKDEFARLRRIRHVALDLDGTIYRGGTIFKTTLPFLKLLADLGIGCTFLTNNPSKSNADYHAKLRGMGICAKEEQLYTSAQSTIEYLKDKQPPLKKLFILGTPSMSRLFAKAGFTLLPDDPKQRPDAVVVGFDPTMTYSRLCRAAWWISRGIPYFATNPDNVCPTDEPTVLVDCGSITAALIKATGCVPLAVLGKPDVAMLRGILRRHALKTSDLAMVGDRLYTDMAMAQRAGAFGVLVLTGETTAKQAAAHHPRIDLVVPSLAELGRLLLRSRDTARK